MSLLAEISESAATGTVAATYAEIRRVTGVPFVVFIYRHAWWNIAGSQGLEDAKKNLVSLEKEMTAEQKAEAMKLARELFARLPKK